MIPKINISPRLKSILALIGQNKIRLLIAMGSMMVVAASTGVQAWLLKPVLDGVFVKTDMHLAKMLPIIIVGIFFLRGIGLYIQAYNMEYVGMRIVRHLRDDLYNRIQDLPLAFFHREKTGTLMSRLTYDVQLVKAMVSTAFAGAIRDFWTILFLTGTIFYLDWKMACYAFLAIPLAGFPLIKFGRMVRRVSTGVQENMADLNNFMHETFVGNKIVKAFGMERHEKKRFAQKTEELFNTELKAVAARSLSSPVMEFLGGVAIAGTIGIGGYTVLVAKTHTPGDFGAFIAAVLLLYDPVKKLTRVNNAIQEGLAAVDRIFNILETRSDIKEMPDARTLVSQPHRVWFDNVCFGYDDELVLQNIQLKADVGEVIALVGMSGGGKTTLVNLIPRFYDVTRGALRIDDIDVRHLTLASLRSEIAVVTQEPILFHDSVRNNIAYGRPQASDTDIEEAAKAAYAYDFITQFPQKFDTPVGELGNRLSGGEKQRLCIARALLKNAPILILDEATSSLDSEAERVVQKALENLMKGRTTFVIAHRLSTVVNADRIVVLVNGCIVESGHHAELMARNGAYFKLHQMQYDTQLTGGCATVAKTGPDNCSWQGGTRG
jgi:subfamily B ATP-binding cassette protein MsbA